MMHRNRHALKVISLALVILGPCWSTSTGAGPNADARILLHLIPVDNSSPCPGTTAGLECYSIVTEGGLAPARYYACVLVANGDVGSGIGGASLGIRYTDTVRTGVACS
ncbi:MAG: hypothetical protein SGI90_05430 [Candidatus Eisenbacteria bacterium]|nr:hypothetical protein [Candidatus Eisenbacteria bacterium]